MLLQADFYEQNPGLTFWNGTRVRDNMHNHPSNCLNVFQGGVLLDALHTSNKWTSIDLIR